jgi:hypoxanthine phosphoribosyltransferase
MTRVGRILIDRETLQRRVAELGREIASDGPDDVLLVTMLKGAVPFMADLIRWLPPAVTVDFLAVNPYDESHAQQARLVKDLDQPLGDRHVLVVEDVVDTGLSLSFLLRTLEARDPASLRVCTLLDRESKRLVELPIAYRGFTLGDEYLVGYGLDFLGLYRNLPCLVSVDLHALRAEPLALVERLREWGIWYAHDDGEGR